MKDKIKMILLKHSPIIDYDKVAEEIAKELSKTYTEVSNNKNVEAFTDSFFNPKKDMGEK